jgi:hypothetical protein
VHPNTDESLSLWERILNFFEIVSDEDQCLGSTLHDDLMALRAAITEHRMSLKSDKQDEFYGKL